MKMIDLIGGFYKKTHQTVNNIRKNWLNDR